MSKHRILQNNLLFWIGDSIDENEADTQHTLEQLRVIVCHVKVFTQTDTFIEALRTINREKVLIITSGSIVEDLVQHMHSLTQVEAIYIFCGDVTRYESWIKTWSKIEGVYDCIRPICKALQTAVKRSNENLTPFSFVQQETVEGSSDVDLNRLEPSFMYTTLFKRVLLTMEHEPDERKALIKFCRAQFRNKDPSEVQIVEELNRDYHPDRAVWWYTRETFLYQMLNRALRLLESDIIVDMGFFLRDLHRQLERLHHEQFNDYNGDSLTLYRGQGLSIDDFAKLKKSRGGLIAFNSFLSTSRDRSVSLSHAQQNPNREDMVGILFIMAVDPKIPSAPFAYVEKYSYFATEEEILFSMHTVFRVGDVTPLDEGQRVFEVRLTLTSDDDPELRRLTDQMETDIEGTTGWDRVGQVLYDVGQMEKAEELYLTLLEKVPNELDRGVYFSCLGLIKYRMSDYKQAVEYHEQAIAIREKVLSPTDVRLATSYNNIGLVYKNMGEYSQALSYLNKSLAIYEKTLRGHDTDFAACCNNVGLVYKNMGEYVQALSYLNKALAILEKTLPPNHPSLATSYNNIGIVYKNTGEYSQALSYYNKCLANQKKTLPPDHPHLASAYNNIGATYYELKQYSAALSYFQKVLDIRQRTLPHAHPHTQATRRWLKLVQEKL